MKRYAIQILTLLLCATHTLAQPSFDMPHGLYEDESLTVAISSPNADHAIRYTLDGSEPTVSSPLYTHPLTFTATTLLRAVEVVGDSVCSTVTTASYIFIKSVLSQSNTPSGYPSQWGAYTQIWGTATADYEMDPEMTGDAQLRPKIVQGLKELPILSVVTDKDYLFSHENDSVKGGIYIFTGPPVGDNTGHGWTRPVSLELISSAEEGFSTTCGLRLHGGHGRLAEKNPKHSFRFVFKEKYGAKSLKYPLFGEGEPQKFDQLVLRCHFGNSWQHWAEGNRQKAQYTRDVWARRMQRKLGHTSVNARYVHLFLNGLYWGLYNLAERVDDQFGKDHLGGQKSDIDVVKIEEDGGNHIEAAEGDLDAWNLLVKTVADIGASSDNTTLYNALQGLNADGEPDENLEPLLDIDHFIDYMLINQYGGNTDWDHHNWYAIRRRGAGSQGFRFLCWDTEMIFENERENTLMVNNGRSFPSGMFHNLLNNSDFSRRYLRRAKALLADDGLLGQQSVVELWDSLYNTISYALYDEAARWGDYRRDVHPWQSMGSLYTVDETYQNERNRLLNNYFPFRSGFVLDNIMSFVDIDDFEAPADWIPLAASMFHEWDGTGLHAQPLNKQVNVDWNFNVNAQGGTAIAGFVNVEYNRFADLSDAAELVLRGTGNNLRILANRLVDHGAYKQITVSFNNRDPYWNEELQAIVLPLDDLRTVATNEGLTRIDDFVHLNAMKVDWNSSVCVRGAYLVPKSSYADVNAVRNHVRRSEASYNLNGQRVLRPTRGIYIVNGRKIVVK
jgi:hypothetical protein